MSRPTCPHCGYPKGPARTVPVVHLTGTGYGLTACGHNEHRGNHTTVADDVTCKGCRKTVRFAVAGVS
jgi:hypothetical protein